MNITKAFDLTFEAMFGKTKKYLMEEVDKDVYLVQVKNSFAEEAAKAWSSITFKETKNEEINDKQYDAINNTKPRSSDSCGR